MEPTRLTVRAIMALRRAAYFERSADSLAKAGFEALVN
jgi:hypothetical protein